jgi:BRCT domain type II-containing protein
MPAEKVRDLASVRELHRLVNSTNEERIDARASSMRDPEMPHPHRIPARCSVDEQAVAAQDLCRARFAQENAHDITASPANAAEFSP